MMQGVHVKLNTGFHSKSSIQLEENSFHQLIGLRKKLIKYYFEAFLSVVLKLGQFLK